MEIILAAILPGLGWGDWNCSKVFIMGVWWLIAHPNAVTVGDRAIV